MRGLKLDRVAKALNRKMSHLLQMRGLKLPSNRWTCTIIKSRIFYRCVDWNITSWRAGSYSLSHLLQMRGLKHRYLKNQWRSLCRIFYRCVDWNLQARKEIDLSPVASFTDAWIETNGSIFPNRATMSHLLQMRGLKRWRSFGIFRHAVSHLLQMRGLKQH